MDTYYTVTVPTTYTVAVPDPVVYYYATPVEVCPLICWFNETVLIFLNCILIISEYILVKLQTFMTIAGTGQSIANMSVILPKIDFIIWCKDSR